MFQKGEYVVYGNVGVCEIIDITTIDSEDVPKDRLYYILHPYYQKGGKIFTPINNQKTIMRKIISKTEAIALIDSIFDIETLWIENDKMREEKYRECIKSCECREWIRIIKTLYLRKKERLAQGKKFTITDSKYLNQAEENLYSELSILLEIPKSEVKKYIEAKVQ